MVDLILNFFGSYLMELMVLVLVSALVVRLVSYKHSKQDEAYFSHFTRELNSSINEDKAKNLSFDDVEIYLNNLLGGVNQKLPERNIRSSFHKREHGNNDSLMLKDFVSSKHGMIASIQNESNVFHANIPPNFSQLTDRIMNDDEHWSKIFGVVPVDGVMRTLDILPTMFIILGVFGTFIGISFALPEIAKMDFNNLEASGQTLTQFVLNVTFAMKTSIAGIFFSIILTMMNTLFPIEVTREGTFEKVETTFEVLWYHLHTDQNKMTLDKEMKQMNKNLNLILDELKQNKNVKLSA